MKKVLGILLTVMMLVSLFAVNASAIIGFTYTETVGAQDEIVMVKQDYSDETVTDFTNSAGFYNKANVEDGCVTLHTPSSTTLHASSITPITEEKWTMEFDVRLNSDFKNTEYYGIFVGCEKAAYKDEPSKVEKFIHKYGIYFPLMDREKDTWYTYRITFDETNAADWWTTISSIVTSAQYKKAGDTEWTKININPNWSWNVTGDNSRLIAGNNYIGYGETSFMFVSKAGSQDMEELAAASISLDNIKAYVPAVEGEKVTKNYPLASGTIHLTKEKPGMPNATLGVQDYVSTPFTTNINTSVAGTTDYFAVTFDAKNTVQGMPLMFHIGGDNVADGIAICPTDTIGTDWYTYKIICSQTSSGGYTGFMSAFRKPTGSDESWTTVNIAPKHGYNPGDEIWACSTPSGGKNCIRIFYYPESAKAQYPNTKWEDTIWEVKNLQVTDEAVIAGFANLDDGTINVDADIVAATGDAGVALAVYDGNRLADIDFARIFGGTGNFDLSANYVDGNAAKLLVWGYSNDGARPIVEALDIAAIAK